MVATILYFTVFYLFVRNYFDADVADPNTDTTENDFRQDLEITVTRAGSIGAKTKE